MSLKNVIISTVAASAIATSVFAGSLTAGQVRTAIDGTGDYLVFPAYFANEQGWSTNLRIVNTNTTASVIAKVVIREGVQSDEKLDFAIFLSPGDVWDGTMYATAGGGVSIKSSDDSMVFNGVPATEAAPYDIPLFPAVEKQVITSGYIEVFGAATLTGTSTIDYNGDGIAESTNFSGGGKPVSKVAIYKEYKSATHPATVTVGAVDNDSISGQGIIIQETADRKKAMTYVATALEGVVGNKVVTPAAALGGTTNLTNMTQLGNGTLPLIDAELNKSASYVVYSGTGNTADQTAFLATFTTKKYHFDISSANILASGWTLKASTDAGVIMNAAGTAVDTGKPTNYKKIYSLVPRDMMENHPGGGSEVSGGSETSRWCDTELCYLQTYNDTPYGNGYVSYYFDYKDSNNPYIGTAMTVKNVGGTVVTNVIDTPDRSASSVY